MTAPSERAQIDAAFSSFSAELKHWLITHPSTRFFVLRQPTIPRDAFGQQLNGVIDVSRTVDSRYPTWSPIDSALYKRYVAGSAEDNAQDVLAKQILDLLGAVHRNLVYGAERMEQEGAGQVVENAVPLLAGVVSHFLPEENADPKQGAG